MPQYYFNQFQFFIYDKKNKSSKGSRNLSSKGEKKKKSPLGYIHPNFHISSIFLNQ
ncbi:hypothetical protein Fmac_006599 [Flemingia macrophylla]|uniref:Uncharacterized protein n=1 Tax=Flemingia macrophylla TaxID=520843 RepID=A0ABD1NB47_9FABA